MNTITQEQVNKIYDEAIKQTFDVFGKCLIMACKLQNGFVIVESSACVDPQNFSFDIGRKICEERVKNKIWEFEGYALQNGGNKEVKAKAETPLTQKQKDMTDELSKYLQPAIEQFAYDRGIKVSDLGNVFDSYGE